jgi:hypothetical protein
MRKAGLCAAILNLDRPNLMSAMSVERQAQVIGIATPQTIGVMNDMAIYKMKTAGDST